MLGSSNGSARAGRIPGHTGGSSASSDGDCGFRHASAGGAQVGQGDQELGAGRLEVGQGFGHGRFDLAGDQGVEVAGEAVGPAAAGAAGAGRQQARQQPAGQQAADHQQQGDGDVADGGEVGEIRAGPAGQVEGQVPEQ